MCKSRTSTTRLVRLLIFAIVIYLDIMYKLNSFNSLFVMYYTVKTMCSMKMFQFFRLIRFFFPPRNTKIYSLNFIYRQLARTYTFCILFFSLRFMCIIASSIKIRAINRPLNRGNFIILYQLILLNFINLIDFSKHAYMSQ